MSEEKKMEREKETKETYYPRASIRVSTQTEEIEVSALDVEGTKTLFDHVQANVRLKRIEDSRRLA